MVGCSYPKARVTIKAHSQCRRMSKMKRRRARSSARESIAAFVSGAPKLKAMRAAKRQARRMSRLARELRIDSGPALPRRSSRTRK